jgi:hypothetical protein
MLDWWLVIVDPGLVTKSVVAEHPLRNINKKNVQKNLVFDFIL